jgi:hypothetical protein
MKRVGLWAMGIGLCLAVGLLTVEHGYAEQDTQRIEGVWDTEVTIVHCGTGDPIIILRAMNMFVDGGTLTEVSTSFQRGSSLGTWRHLSGRSYTAVFRYFRLNAAGIVEKVKITRTIELSQDADVFTATGSFGPIGNDDNFIGVPGCATEIATRLE